MRVFATVGSTQFDELVRALLSDAVLGVLRRKGCTQLVVQYGRSDVVPTATTSTWLELEMWAFKPTIEDDVRHADLVISHAGAGTILEVLRLGKPLIVVPNPTLLDNHQEELASKLDALGHLRATSVSELSATLAAFDPAALIPFLPFDGSRFRKLVDEEMGFV